MSTPEQMRPEQMRAAVARYVEEIHRAYSVEGLSWTVRFFDPVALPELALIDESDGPAFGEVRHAGVGARAA